MRIFLTGGSGFIGTNAIDVFSEQGHSILNYSVLPPLKSAQDQFWRKGDIMEKGTLRQAMEEFRPDWIWHLAARAECDESATVETGYRVNTEGTQNVLDAISASSSVQRAIITSSQFVCGPGRLPKDETDCFPETTYGQSKVITEQLTRNANLPVCWTIVRPTNIWGPWHMRYKREFWRAVQRGWYVHPGRQEVIRCYGYVKNVVFQVQKILETPPELVRGKTLYVGDPPINLFDYAEGFSQALTGRSVRVVPRFVMRLLAAFGDIPTKITGRPFLINSSRLRSMMTDYDTPMQATFDLLGPNPYPLDLAIKETAEWLGSYHGPDRLAGGS